MARLENYDPDRPLILLTDYSPRFGGGGATNLRSVLDPEARRRVIWATLEPDPSPGSAIDPDEPVIHLRGGPGAVPRASRSIWKDMTSLSRPLADELIEIARRHRARGFWVVMHGAAVPVAARLVEQGEFPVLASVHDDPAFGVALRSRRHLALVPLIERALARALRGAAGVEVVSRGMLERYRRRYGVEAKLGNRGVAPFEREPAPFDKAERVLRVGVLGSTYSYAPVPRLARALARAAEGLGVRGELVFVGHGHADRVRAAFGDRIGVVGHGHVPEERAAEILRRCFLNYLAYPFGWRDRVLRRTSFPIKLATYMAAGRPLLLHTPPDSTTAELAEIPGLACYWPSNDPAEGAAALRRAWDDPATSLDAHAGLEEVRRRYFDLETIRTTLFGMLDGIAGPLPP
jgi:glycosyltransferase involved in cell wall biosynthesis